MEIWDGVERAGSLQPWSSTHTGLEGVLVPKGPSILGVTPVVDTGHLPLGKAGAVESLAVLSVFTGKLPKRDPRSPLLLIFSPQSPLHFCFRDSTPLV